LLAARGAAAVVADAAQLADALERLFADAAQRRRMGEAGILIVAANRGSVAALVELIEPALAGA
jgi:3-deoxy-D-manno-octulosonic-acid transferase